MIKDELTKEPAKSFYSPLCGETWHLSRGGKDIYLSII